MNRLTLGVAVLTFAGGAVAQHLNTMSPVRPMPAPPNALPYGNILFPGGISFPQRLGGTISGSIPYSGVPGRGDRGVGVRPGYGGPYSPGSRNRTVVVPYAVPVFTGGFGYGYADYGMVPQQPNVTVVVPQQPTPSVIINQHYTPQEASNPVLRDYSSADLPDSGIKVYEANPAPRKQEPKPGPARSSVSDQEPTIYLIALNDTTVRQAIGYWVDDNTLHYVTPKASINHISMDMVDRETTVRLNSERKLDFDFNAAKK
jgi:hypothetical protein